MYTRIFKPPQQSFFLFGPRGTGKTTCLKQHYPNAKWYNLLLRTEYFKLLKNTDLFIQETLALPKKSIVVVDEIQKLPALLDEVQALIAERPDLRFILTGSSARKLKRAQANLLAGRVVQKSFFPISLHELDYPKISWKELVRWGFLPGVLNLKQEAEKIDFLETYASTYLKEEIQEEALVRNIENFSRFLDVAALMNGQVTNVSNIARDAGVVRPTVQGYFQILSDTLIGSFLPAFKLKAKVKEIAHSKFYFFDSGVVRVLSGRHREPLDTTEAGFLFETWMINEMRAYTHYFQLGGEFYYWRTPSRTEVDLIWKRGNQLIAFEFKSSEKWKPEFSQGLLTLLGAGKVHSAYGVYTGTSVLKSEKITIYPYSDFIKKLYRGEIFGSS